MRTFIAIFFLTIFSLSFTGFRQLLKLPNLVRHYYAHVDRGTKTSFVDFIQHHYLKTHNDDGDRKEDDSLPFKSSAFNNIGSTTSPPSVEYVNSERPLVTKIFLHDHSLILTERYFSVFHPPRIG